MPKHICIVTSGHIGSAPRVVKEADALVADGYRVTVVAIDLLESVRARDRSVLARASWQARLAGRGRPWRWHRRTLWEHVCRWGWRLGLRSTWLAEAASGRMVGELTRLAAGTHADLFIGHNLPGLCAAGRAATQTGGLLAFDAEDDHPGEVEDVPGDPAEVQRRVRIMRRWLPRCAFLTAAAPRMAANLRQRFGLPFVPLLNVFPLSDAQAMPAPRCADQPLIYWFSQTIGAGRGLEPLLAILARCRTPFRLDLRGTPSSGYEAVLRGYAAELAWPAERLQLLPPADPDQMSRLSAGYALGASLELSISENRRSCLTNKIFQYLLAGLPVLLSTTPAQRELADALGEAAVLIDLDDPAASAARLDAWYQNHESRIAAVNKAHALAQTRYNWDTEQGILLRQVILALGSTRSA
ncbi:MAG: hypothetical protein AB7E78_15160 [Porticoccaceae bacterium]